MPPWSTFPQAPLRSRTVGFPQSGLTLASHQSPSHTVRSSSADSHTPLHEMVCFHGRSSVPRPYNVRGLLELPSAQSPFARAGVTSHVMMSRTRSAGITPPASLLRAHAPVLPPPRASVVPSTPGLCRLLSAPAGRRTFPTLSLRIFPCVLGPLPRRLVWCTYPFLPTRQRPSPRSDRVGAPQCPYSDFSTAPFSRLQSFPDVQARRFARHPDRSYRYGVHRMAAVAFHPSLSRFVTSPCPGYAHRLDRAIDGMGTCTPSDAQPCRLLPER